MKIYTREVEGRVILHLMGEIVHSTVAELGEKIHSSLGQGKSKILLDFEKVYNLDGPGAGFLANLDKEAYEQGGSIKIFSVQTNVIEVLKSHGLEAVFETYQNERDALADVN